MVVKVPVRRKSVRLFRHHSLEAVKFCLTRAALPAALVLLTICAGSPLRAQALRLSSAAARPGDQVAIDISLQVPAGLAPQTMQWETTIPDARLSFLEDLLEVGPAAKAADKSFACATKPAAAGQRTLLCILAGGLKPIPNGVIGRLRLRI
jgi:hypothetical protein